MKKGYEKRKGKNESKWIGLLAAVLLCALEWNTLWRQTHTPSEAAPARDTPVPPPVTILNADGFAHEGSGNVESPVLPGQDLSGMPTDECSLPSGDSTDDSDLWYLILVNNQHPVPDHYTVDLVEVAGGKHVDVRIYDPLMEMLEDAKEAKRGQAPVIVSGYRTFDDQPRIYDDKVKNTADRVMPTQKLWNWRDSMPLCPAAASISSDSPSISMARLMMYTCASGKQLQIRLYLPVSG